MLRALNDRRQPGPPSYSKRMCQELGGTAARPARASSISRGGQVLEGVPNRTEVIGRVRHDRHAVAGLLIAPGLQTFEPFDQRSIFLSNVAFELIPFTISDLLQPPTRRPVDLLFPSHRVVVDHADVVPQMRAVGRDRQGQILFLARLSTSTDTPKEDNCARNKI